jgi:ADP-ribose pyrophosphatase
MTDTVRHKSSRPVYADPYLQVEERTFEHKGRDYGYLVKDEPDFSVVGALTAEGEVVMVRQFRPGPGKYLLDLPGGMIDPGQTAEDAARAELLEETGYAGEIVPVTTAFVTAYSTARKHIFLARNCRKVAEAEEEENIIGAPLLVTKEEFAEIIRAGDMLDLDCALILAREIGLDWPLTP